MARGWESKSVEDQMASAEANRAPKGPIVSPQNRERESRKAGLLLSRAKTLNDIEHARDDAYRLMLQQALDYLDAQIATLEVESKK